MQRQIAAEDRNSDTRITHSIYQHEGRKAANSTTRTALQDVVCKGLFGCARAYGHHVEASLLGAQDVAADRQVMAAKCFLLHAGVGWMRTGVTLFVEIEDGAIGVHRVLQWQVVAGSKHRNLNVNAGALLEPGVDAGVLSGVPSHTIRWYNYRFLPVNCDAVHILGHIVWRSVTS